MKKKLRFVFITALFTAAGIIVFQFYWLYKTYKVSEHNFISKASDLLQESINTYRLQQLMSEHALSTQPKVSVIMSSANTPEEAMEQQHAKDVLEHSKDTFGNVGTAVDVSSSNLQMVQMLMAGMAAQASNKTVDLTALKQVYTAALNKNNIQEAFTLKVIKNDSNITGNMVTAKLGFADNSMLVHADFATVHAYLLWQNILPFTISLLLILVTSGCLWYMLYIIQKQVKLDDMKNNFINNMTHELRTPVAILKSTHEALDTFGNAADTAKTIRYLQMNRAVLDKLENSIDRILDITQYEKGIKPVKLEAVDIKIFMNEIIQRFIVNDCIQCHYHLQQPQVITDKYIIDAIVTNLVDNALKYTKDNPVIQVDVNSNISEWYIQVSDNGIGIATEYLPNIFDKFYRVPSGDLHDVKGYGLGLSYVKELVSLLKGTIKVSSNAGIGTVFTIQFPVNE